jgi:IclR family transcriptional regulator, acetate operon repressor
MSGRVLPMTEEQSEIASETSSTLKAVGVLEVLVRAGHAYMIGESCNLAVLNKGALIDLDRIEADWPLRLQIPVSGPAAPPRSRRCLFFSSPSSLRTCAWPLRDRCRKVRQ